MATSRACALPLPICASTASIAASVCSRLFQVISRTSATGALRRNLREE
jgi:hypothetical protein